jgi:hypothetical protein
MNQYHGGAGSKQRVLEASESTELTRVPSFAKVSTLGLNKKILFQHFKHGMRSTS